MTHANTRKLGVIDMITKNLTATAFQALRKLTQAQVAKKLGVADSTVLRRTEKFGEVFETLAAMGIQDFVTEGQRVVDEDEYRTLIKYAMNWMSLQKERAVNAGADTALVEMLKC